MGVYDMHVLVLVSNLLFQVDQAEHFIVTQFIPCALFIFFIPRDVFLEWYHESATRLVTFNLVVRTRLRANRPSAAENTQVDRTAGHFRWSFGSVDKSTRKR